MQNFKTIGQMSIEMLINFFFPLKKSVHNGLILFIAEKL